MRPFLKAITLLLVISLILLPGALLFAISDGKPLAKPPTQVTPQMARQVKQIAQQLQFGLYYFPIHTLSFSETDIANLFAVAARAIPRLSGDARISERGSEVRVTLHLPENPFGHYLNLRLGLPMNAQGLVIDHLAIGNITLHGNGAQALIKGLANLAFGGDEGTKLLATIKQIRSTRDRLIITYKPTPHLDEKVAAALQRLQPWREETTIAESAAIRSYYMQLCKTGYRPNAAPLSQPLSASLELAASRSASGKEAASENRAALLALAIYFGNYRFNTMINAIPDATIKQCQHHTPEAMLAGRKDLALHFIYSAAIKIIADSQMSFAVGELKEMMDSLQGGSGFSFVDLTADESGIRFAELATAPESARTLQSVAAELATESRFFPAITGLREGIPQKEFDAEYGGSSGDRYNQQLDEIRRRINALALYQPRQ